VSVAKEATPTLSYEEALEVVAAAREELFRIDLPREAMSATTTATSTAP